MNPYSSHLLYKNVFGGSTSEEGLACDPILAADFSDIQFMLTPAIILTISNVTGEFEVGEVVTGAPSGATGVVLGYLTETRILVNNVVGTFTAADGITGGTSGATADLDEVDLPIYTIGLFKSNQPPGNPPDPSLPSTPDNSYEQIAYMSEATMVNYSVGSEFNPNTGSPTGTPSTAQQSFRAGTQGAVWVFLKILDQTGGSLANADIDLFNN